RQWINDALVSARALAYPFRLSQALLFTALLQQFLRQPPVAQERLEEQLVLCPEHGFAHWKPWGTIMRGWCGATQGQAVEGLAQIREGLADWRARGVRLTWPWFLALLAEVCGRAGQVEGGLHALHEALEAMQTMEDRIYDAEVYRLTGELLLQQS